MDDLLFKPIGVGVLFLLVIGTGYWLKRLGKPYPGGAVNVHKFIGLAGGALLAVTIRQMHLAAALRPVEIAASAVSGVLFVTTIITGGLVSLAKPMPGMVALTHRVFPYLTAAGAAVTLYLLLSRPG